MRSHSDSRLQPRSWGWPRSPSIAAVEEEEFLLAKTRLLERVRTRANPRKEAALLQMFTKGPDALKGYLYAARYRTAIDAPSAIAKLVCLFSSKSVHCKSRSHSNEPVIF